MDAAPDYGNRQSQYMPGPVRKYKYPRQHEKYVDEWNKAASQIDNGKQRKRKNRKGLNKSHR
jgi:hypothetical protein